MNILPLVFTVLLVLVLFTQAQMENFTRFTFIQKEYDDYMSKRAREHLNQRQEALFKTGPKKEKDTRNKRNFCKNINFRLILDKKIREKDDDKYQQHRLVAKELIKVLYREKDFYKEIEEKRPNFIDELFDRMIAVSENRKIIDKADMGKLELDDEDLQKFFYNMMAGSEKSEDEAKKNPKQKKINKPVVKEEDEEDPGEDPEEDYQAEKRYVTLKGFIHFHPNQKQIQLYLAPKEIIQAIFEDEGVAHQFIELREDLYLKGENIEIAMNKLSEFKNKLKPGIKEDILYFGVSKSDPREK